MTTTYERGYYDNGQIHHEHPFMNGKLHGIRKAWYENGQLVQEHTYVNDVEHGIGKQYDESGKLVEVTYHLYGEQVTKEEYQKHELITKLAGLNND